MKPKRRYVLIIALLMVVLTGIAFWPHSKAPEIDESKIANASMIEYPSEFNYAQTLNDCGPFNTAAVVRAITKNEVSSAEFARNIGWKMPNGYTLPWGLEKQLKANGIKIEVPNLSALSDEDRIAFLRERLSQGKPVIILGERDSIQHFVTILGFNSEMDAFYVYDSLLEEDKEGITVDDNDSSPGNRNYSSSELLDFWRGGGIFGKFVWYAIVAGDKNSHANMSAANKGRLEIDNCNTFHPKPIFDHEKIPYSLLF